MRARVLDWRTRLVDWGLALRGRPFVWGQTDCATLARQALVLCFGRDLTVHVPLWHSAREAAEILKQHPIVDELKALGAEERPLAFARAGDLVLMEETDDIGGVSIGVVIDASAVVASSTVDGVQLVDLQTMPENTLAYSLWEVPDNG